MKIGYTSAAALMMSITGFAHAQSYESVIDSGASSANIDSTVVFDASGSLIGDYDAKTNPDGTQTRPGFFGGSGNQPINTTTILGVDTSLDTNPSGAFTIVPDFDLGLVDFEGLSIDLLNGDLGSSDLSITLSFDTFRTVSPSFLYPGGIPITLPLGQVGQISSALLTQAGAGTGTLVATADPDVFDLAGLIAAELDLDVSFALPGSDPVGSPIEALPIVLPVAGQVTRLNDGSLLITIAFSPDAIMVEIPIEGVSLPAIPFELPTLGSDTASVIFTLAPEFLSLEALVGVNISASATQSVCSADLNNDGLLNFFDVSAFLSAFTSMSPAADFTGDGLYNFFDVSAFLGAFSAGCP